MNPNQHTPHEEAFEQWLREETPLSSDFTERTLSAIRDDAHRQFTPKRPALLRFPGVLIPLTAAAALVLGFGLSLLPTPTSAPTQENLTIAAQNAPAQQADQANADTSIYNDPDYLVYEELLLMQASIETVASVDAPYYEAYDSYDF